MHGQARCNASAAPPKCVLYVCVRCPLPTHPRWYTSLYRRCHPPPGLQRYLLCFTGQCNYPCLPCHRLPSNLLDGAAGTAVLLLLLARATPVVLAWQQQGMRLLHSRLAALDIQLASSSGGASVVVAVAVPLFVAVAVLQGLLLRAPLFSDPRKLWFERMHANLLIFVDELLAGDGSNEAIVESLRHATAGAFDTAPTGAGSVAAAGLGIGGAAGTVMELVVLDEASWGTTAEDATVTSYLVHGSSEAHGLPVRRLPLRVLHSVHHALSHQATLFTNSLPEAAMEARYEDWQLMHQVRMSMRHFSLSQAVKAGHGMRCYWAGRLLHELRRRGTCYYITLHVADRRHVGRSPS